MLQNLLIILMILVTILFSQMIHPLSMGLMLLCQTLIFSLFIGLMNESFWFSYILFLVFLGGMLILFIYVTSVASNEKFSIKINFTILLIPILGVLMNYDPMMISTIMNSFTVLNDFNPSLMKMFNFPNNFITIILMNYLLLALIAVVKITNIFYGPLRQMFN